MPAHEEAELVRLCRLLERVDQPGSEGGFGQVLEAASDAASYWTVKAAQRASEWAQDPARDQEWDRAVEVLARLDSPEVSRLFPDSLSGCRARVQACCRRVFLDETLERPLHTRGAHVVELGMGVARLGAAANQALVRGAPPPPFNNLPLLRKALVAPPGSDLAARMASEDQLASDAAGVRAQMAVSATVGAAQLLWSAAMALRSGLGAGIALEQAEAAWQQGELIRLLDRLMEPAAVQPALFDCGM